MKIIIEVKELEESITKEISEEKTRVLAEYVNNKNEEGLREIFNELGINLDNVESFVITE